MGGRGESVSVTAAMLQSLLDTARAVFPTKCLSCRFNALQVVGFGGDLGAEERAQLEGSYQDVTGQVRFSVLPWGDSLLPVAGDEFFIMQDGAEVKRTVASVAGTKASGTILVGYGSR